MALKASQYNLRIDRILLDKIAYVAGSEERSINGELLILVKKRIAEFEKEFGTIPIERECGRSPGCDKCRDQ